MTIIKHINEISQGYKAAIDTFWQKSAALESVQGQKILIIDNMINTGSTTIKATELPHQQEAAVVDVAVYHSVFAPEAIPNPNASIIGSIIFTNTLPQASPLGKIAVHSLGSLIQSIVEHSSDAP